MARIKVNYSGNQSFYVSDQAVKDIILKASKEVRKSKILNSEITIDPSGTDFSVVIDAEIKGEFKESLLELTKEIETLSMNVIDVKPLNISINVVSV